ncbi:MAG: Cytochrome c551/c552 [uncultured Nocardioidaceae bacterium]|uniref:Cytochrome c551/c552 n=1 Tax=uncultured Nocardioidaceae bacterium TaxID=253824 RepID=A0A6J4NRY1_9ACTN|nr:MAG: Cytochrome c551/c552 [uncultured Nocardioidaceae bacterium]
MRRASVGAVLLLLLGTVHLAAPRPAAALTLPPGFQLVDYETGQAPYNLTNFAWLDDGGLLTSGKDGTVTYVPPGGVPTVIGTVPSVRAVADHGLLGFALGNDYADSGSVFISYDKGDPAGTGFGMVEEWKAFPPDHPESFTYTRTIIDGSTMTPQLVQGGPTHAIDSILVAPDDTLFLSIGDDSLNNGDPRTLRAQDLDQPYGKLLHFTADGEGVPSNPWYATTAPGSWRSMVYSYGLRNPFRFSLDPRSGVPYVADVGWGRVEEVNTLEAGANGGWPCYEGTKRTTFKNYEVCKQLYAAGTARMPIWTYPHVDKNNAVVGGMHYTGTSYPEEYHGSYFFGDYSRSMLWTLAATPTGELERAPETEGFAVDAGGPVAFQPGPNGDVTYADIVSGTVRRLVHTAGNRAPLAELVATTDAETRTVSFSGSGSYDLDGDTLSHHWDFGDGAEAEGAEAEHTYDSDQPVEVTLTVTDQLGATDTATATVHPANHTPELALELPDPGTYAVGDLVELSATATDAEDGDLTVSWDTALEHCPFAGSCHLHPDGTTTGPSYARPFTDHGNDTTMLVTARAVDSNGATATSTYEAVPTLRTLTVRSPVAVGVNGALAVSSDVVAGSTVQLTAPTRSAHLTFRDWSDGGAAAHSFTMPDADLVLTARYRSAISRKYAALGGRSSFLGAPTSLEYDVPGGRARNYTGGRLYWGPGLGAHEVHGRILAKYAAVGHAGSCLGLPVTDVQTIPGGRRSEFAGGTITYRSRSGRTISSC